MGNRTSLEISCILCSKPVDLRTDLCADENGKATHEDCYVAHVTSNRGDKAKGRPRRISDERQSPSQAFIEFVNSASTHWATNSCPACGTGLKYRDCTFFYEGQTWGNPLHRSASSASHYTRRPTTSSIGNKIGSVKGR